MVAYVGLGSNLGDPSWQLRDALDKLAGLPDSRLLRCSSFYRSAPWGVVDQPDFVNAVAGIETTLAPGQLLAELLAIEQRAGRTRGVNPRWGPRLIDLDLLLYADRCISENGLQVPHPRIAERAFVLVPLAELDPLLEVPGQGCLTMLLARIDANACTRLESPRS